MAYQQSVDRAEQRGDVGDRAPTAGASSQKYRAKAEQLQQNETDLVAETVAGRCRAAPGDQDASLESRARRSDAQAACERSSRRSIPKRRARSNAQRTRRCGDAGGVPRPVEARRPAPRCGRRRRDPRPNPGQDPGAPQRGRRATAQSGPAGASGQPSARRRKPRSPQIHRSSSSQFQADAQKTIADYKATRPISTGNSRPHGADVGATGAAAKELDALQKRRDDLYKQIVDQVTREAARIAKDRGFSIVFDNVAARPPAVTI